MSDAFESWFDKRINEETLPTVEEAFESGRNSMLAELRAKFPNELEAHTQVKLLCKDDDVSKPLVMSMWLFIGKRVFG
jgi:hypothetical protein